MTPPDHGLPSPAPDPGTAALACVLPAGGDGERQLWIPGGGRHRIHLAHHEQRDRLLAALFDPQPARDRDLKLVLLGTPTDALTPPARAALRSRIAFLPADGGLISELNGWENIVLPLGFHHPERLGAAAARVHALLDRLGMEAARLLARLPEEMRLYEKKLAGCVRELLMAPDLLLVDNVVAGLSRNERQLVQNFAAAYHSICPHGSFIELDDDRGA